MKEPYVPMKLNLLTFSIPGVCGNYDPIEHGGLYLENMPCDWKVDEIRFGDGEGTNLQNS